MPTRDMPPGWKRITPLDGPEYYAKGEYIVAPLDGPEYYAKGEYIVERLQVDGLSPEWYWSTKAEFYATPYPDPVTCAVACELFNGGCDAQEHSL